MAELSETEQRQRLAALFAPEDGETPDVGGLDPGQFTGLWRFVALALNEGRTIDAVWNDLDAESRSLLLAVAPGAAPPCLGVVTARDLLAKVFPAPVWAVPGLLPAGLTFLAGRAKVGKSWLALQIAQAIATGGRVFGEKVERGPVLYLALEDSQRRLQERMALQGWPAGDAAGDADFMTLADFARDVGQLDAGGCEKLAAQWAARRYRLAILDTLSRAIRGDQNDVATMTAALSPLQSLALGMDAAMLVLDHHKKMTGDATDPVLDLGGSIGKGAVADGLLGLYREQGKAGAILHMLGRDMPEKKLRLAFDVPTRCWQSDGDADAPRVTDARQAILDALGEMGPATAQAVTRKLGKDKANVWRTLQGCVNDGLVISGKDGLYALAK